MERYVKAPRPGKKDMTGRPLEKGIRKVLKEELAGFNVSIPDSGKKFTIWEAPTKEEEINIISDCMIKKQGYPTSIVSVKSWIGSTQLRETFAYAYFSKSFHGQKNIRVYMVGLQPIRKDIKDLAKICRPYIDGVYSLSEEPYIDELIEELKVIYK
jgi:hypothetical protein